MCGIAGVIGTHVSVAMLKGMSDRMVHRGPDGEGLWIRPDQRLGLASRRLAVIDLSDSGQQPMHSQSGSVLVFNGEIYNHVELRLELQSRGVVFQGHSDTEVLLAAYDTWGSGCLSRLNGMFAFAIYDPRRDVLFAARDRLGEKPFHFTQLRDGTFAFASEIKSLLALPGVPCSPDMDSVFRFLRYRELDRDPRTFFEGIHSLPAAHALEMTPGATEYRTYRYWELEDRSPLDQSPNDLIDEFRALLWDSTALRLRADVPVGSSLSGGLDSSVLVGLIARSGESGRQHAFSARFAGSSVDEGRYIDAVVAATGVSGHGITPEPGRFVEEISDLAWHQEAPVLSLSVYAQWSVMRLARDHDVTVLIDGQGADEILGGYRMYFGALLLGLFRSGSVRALGHEVSSYLRHYGLANAPLIAYSQLPRGIAQQVKYLSRTSCIDMGFAQAHGGPPETYDRTFRDPLSNQLHETLTHTMLPSLLRYADRNSMAFSREVRLPFLDHRLVEFAFTLPNELKIHRATTKVVLREAMDALLPPLVAHRRDKVGFAVPQSSWLRGHLRSWATTILESPEFSGRRWIDARAANEAWRRYLSGASNLEPDIWRWLSLECWAREYLDPGARHDA